MARTLTEPELLRRDGTSQAARLEKALDPGYVSVDERTLEDLLAFARVYGEELAYYDDGNRRAGDWSAFVDPALDLKDVVAFMKEPERFGPEAELLRRPHFVLFLAFLELFRKVQGELNGLTRRHLDFYYRKVLRMAGKPAVPDRVHLLFDLDEDVEEALVPAGRLLDAGSDSLGRDRVYATDRDLVVNRAQVAKVSSLYVERRVTGIPEAREDHRGDTPGAALAMLGIALGHPWPGDPLPSYPDGGAVDFDRLVALAELLKFCGERLYLEFFELHDLIELERRRAGSDDEWQEINGLLEKAARTRTGDPAFSLSPADPRDFDANLAAAVGGAPNFDGLPEVEDVNDLYDQRLRQDVRDFLRDELYFEVYDDFVRMMQVKVRIDNEWKAVNRLLEQAGRRKDPQYRMDTAAADFDPTDFTANFESAVGPVDFSPLAGVDDVESYYDAVVALEGYFFLSAEEYLYFMDVVARAWTDATAGEWETVDRLLTHAYLEKVYAGRRDELRQIREAAGFTAMIRRALGEEGPPGEDPEGADAAALERLQPYLGNEADAAFLEEVRQAAAAGGEAELDWPRVYAVVEVAWRNREGFVEQAPEKVEWINFHPAPDATAVTVGGAAPGEIARWRTFGMPAPNAALPGVGPDEPPPSVLGWAVSSPLLALSEGVREIRLTLGFRAEPFDEDELRGLLEGEGLLTSGPLRFEVSTAKGWIEPWFVVATIGDYRTLSGTEAKSEEPVLSGIHFRMALAADADAVVASPADPAAPDAPVLRLVLRQTWNGETGRYETLYPPFRDLRLAAVHLGVDVAGLGSLELANDESTLDAKKPFLPFGSDPAVGSRFLIGHSELVTKRLDRLTFHLEWMAAPSDLAAHYADYGLGADPGFNVRVGLVDRNVDYELAGQAALFSGSGATRVIEVTDVPAALPETFPYERLSPGAIGDDLLDWDRYLKWNLGAPDFQHSAYPVLALQKKVNPPYTPKLKSLKIDYSASAEVRLDGSALVSEVDRVLHLHPFGGCGVEAERTRPESVPFLPRLDDAGELFVGLAGVRAPQALSLLFQMAEGSADPDVTPEPVRWSYLAGDRWLDLGGDAVLVDGTRGLINSGILELSLPAAAPSTRLPGELYWIRAAVSRHATGVCDTVAIHTQAVSATFVDQDNAPDHFSRPLPAETLTELAESIPEISGLRQPYTSYGGRRAEEERLFNTRVSERLRHKQHALSAWDYERLVLERFPEIYKVKCIPASLAILAEGPGRVVLVVIPDVREKLPFDPFEPKAPADLLADVEAYLAPKIPASATLEVKNAHYVAVMVSVAVRFRERGNEGYYRGKLNEELNRFLSPWAYEEGADIAISGRIYANSLVDFLDRRPYVDYVADLALFTSDDGQNFRPVPTEGTEGYCVATERPDGVLVAAREHRIDLIPEAGYDRESKIGINFMQLELDFVVA